VPYQQTEAFRFGNPIVDDWEGRVNAWPLDEGLIDYTSGDYGNEENALATLNVIATPKFTLSGTEIDASTITPELISGTLHEADGIEANVASGYHAIEFLLWGQDLNGTNPGAGRAALHRLRHGRRLHRRQLRPPRRLSASRDRPSGRPT
jgi:putative iron-regulated protein